MEMELVQKIKECQDGIKKTIRSEIDVFLQGNIKGNEDTRDFIKECVVNQTMLNLIQQEIFSGSERNAHNTKDQLEKVKQEKALEYLRGGNVQREEVLKLFREAREAKEMDFSSSSEIRERSPKQEKARQATDTDSSSKIRERSPRLKKILKYIDELEKTRD